jgi:hypothetical protein
MTKKGLSRRQLLIAGGAGLASASLIGRAAAQVQPPAAGPNAGNPMAKLPWPYAKPLDPDKAGDRGQAGYKKLQCMYGAFEAMVAPVAEQLGAPYTSFPFEMMQFGAGGIAGWGTICGALNGAAAALKILSPKPDAAIDALFHWYETEALPDYVPAGGAKFPNIKTVARSPLCHQSVSVWINASGKKTYSPERSERCGLITACVARKAVMLLNDQVAGKALPVISGPAKTCGGCHEKGGVLENTRSKMNCTPCHDDLGKQHPKI